MTTTTSPLPAPPPAATRTRYPARRAAVFAPLLALLLGLLLCVLGGSPILLVAVVLVLGSWVLARVCSWVLSTVGTIVLLLAGHTVLSRTAPLLGWDYGAAGVVVLAVTGSLLLLALARTPMGQIARPARAQWLTAAAALALPLLSALLLFGAQMFGRPGYAWAMNNDMVWNTVAARFVLADGGLAASGHPNPSPLMNALVASWIAPGRDAAGELLRHDIARQAELWVLLTLLAAALAGLIVARAVPSTRPLLRFCAGVLGSAIPLSWYATGAMLEFGFLNAMLAVALLLGVWLIWQELPARPVLASALMVISITLLLSAWAPLAVLPLGLAVAGVLPRWRFFVGLRGPAAWAWWAAALQLPAYLLVVTLPDLARDGGALAADGAVPQITVTSVLTAGALLFTLSTVAAIGLGRRHDLAGVVVVLLTGGIGVGYLLAQRFGIVSLWGYYPVKLSWLLSILFTVLLAASILGWLGRSEARGLLGLAVVGACLIVVGLGLRALPMQGGPAGALSLLNVAANEARGGDTVRTDRLFLLADDGSRTIASRLGTPGEDAFVNGWLLQLQADSSQDPIRTYSYTLDPVDPVMLCEAAAAWGGEVTILTADATLEAELATACPRTALSVRMAPAVSSAD